MTQTPPTKEAIEAARSWLNGNKPFFEETCSCPDCVYSKNWQTISDLLTTAESAESIEEQYLYLNTDAPSIGSSEMAKNKIREAFEVYYSDQGDSPRAVERDTSGKYILIGAVTSWEAWREASNQQVRVVLNLLGENINYKLIPEELDDDQSDAFQDGYKVALYAAIRRLQGEER